MDPATHQLEFGRFRIDVRERSLLRDGTRVPLTRKAFSTLCALVERAGKTVAKRELMDLVWPDTVVGEATLAQNIYTLRQALQAGGAGDAIVTRPGVGYAFLAPLRRIDDEARGAPPAPVRSIAVLPFRSLDGNPSHSHLGICLADALITRLSRTRDLVVRPSSAIFPFAGRELDPVAVGRDLAVDAVLMGTLVASDGRLRANVQLVDVRANAPLWAERFDVPFTDIFVAEDEISDQVARTLRIPGGGADRAGPSGHRTVDEDAYRAYVRGRYFWNQRTRDGLDRAVQSFRYALTVEPGYAAAHAGLADCYALYPIHADVPPRDSFPRAQSEALRALELDPGIPEPHASLAYTRFLWNWDWAAAEAGFRRALDIDPRYATAHHWLATLLSARGRADEAVATAKRALELDPLSLVIHSDLGLFLHFAGRIDEAVAHCRRTVELHPTAGYGHFVLAMALGEGGDMAGAVGAARTAVALSGESTLALSLLGNLLGRAGETGGAREVLAKLKSRSADGFVPAARFALVHTGLGDREAALACWTRACEERSRFAVFLDVWPLGPVREDPRFRALVERMDRSAGPGAT